MERFFLRHPRSLGETYLQHQAKALAIAWVLLRAAAACAVHALAPALFEATASRLIRGLNQGLEDRGGRRGQVASNRAGASIDSLEYQI